MDSRTEPGAGKPRHYHLIGIGGTAMGSLAGLLRAAGHTVTGSDENVYPPMSTQLRELGIPYREGYSPENLRPRPDVVVVGNAISRGNPELEAVLREKIPYTSAAAVIKEEFIRGRHSLAVAGTHGKTTTTSILAWVLESAGLNPSFLIGGVAENFGVSFRLTDSRYFVIEADEYDTAYFDKGPKMWHYLPDTAIVNNIEFDHADIYRDEEAYRFAFVRFINLVPGNGTLVAGWDSPIVRELAARSWAPVQGFSYSRGGEDDEAAGSAPSAPVPEVLGASSTLQRPPLGRQPRWVAEDVEFGADLTRFRVLHDGEEWGVVETPLAGAFNVRNCLAVIAAAESVGADPARVREGLRTFRSVRRRMEVRGEVGGVTVIDDFAHHPTAVRETLEAARQRYAGRPIVAVFEPRSYTAQRREFQDAYVRAFGAARDVVLAGLFHPERYSSEVAMDPHQVVEALRAQGKDAAYVPQVDEIVRHVTERLRGGEVILVMSNGGFGGIHGKLLDALRARAA
ncbi:MAG TPA: UDP-N-acetylmuramate--L-alanine ligase [Longimicrobiaceae bacterium]|nr:UDP-N-acetylmuramate--L-alanine ligase [Longimicrobiaceae bacterium]